MNWPTRPLKSTDKNFVTKTWVEQLRWRQYPFCEMSQDAISKLSVRIRSLVDVAKLIIACDEKDDDVIYGFICYEDGPYLGNDTPTLHFVWTRNKLRRNGVANILLSQAFGKDHGPLHYTHITKALNNGNLKKKWRLKNYDPYLIEGALFRDARKIDTRAIYWSQIPGQVSPT